MTRISDDPHSREYRSLPRLVRDLVNDAGTLVRGEITLLRLEVAQTLRAIGRRVGQMMFGGSMALGGLLALGSFAVVGLGLLLGGRYWLSALLVGILLFVGGAATVFLGVRSIGRAMSPPRETIASIRKTREWISDEVRSIEPGLKLGAGRAADQPDRLDSAPRSGTSSAGTLESSASGVSASVTPAGVGSGLPAAEFPSVGEGRVEESLAASTERAGGDRLRSLLGRLRAEIQADDVPGQAAKVAYYMFLSLPPAILVLFGLTGIFGGDGVANFIMDRARGILPGSLDDPDSAVSLVSRFVDQVVHENAPGPLSIGLVLGLWSSSAMFVAIAEALNVAYGVEETRPWVRRRLTAVGVMLVFLLLFLAGSALIIAGPQMTDLLPFGGAARSVWNFVQWPAASVLTVAAMFLVYYVLPNRDQRAAGMPVLWGALTATALWLIGTSGFRVYVANFSSYSDSYGFVGAILVLLLWMYLTGFTILVGGELAAELERGRWK